MIIQKGNNHKLVIKYKVKGFALHLSCNKIRIIIVLYKTRNFKLKVSGKIPNFLKKIELHLGEREWSVGLTHQN